jgi:hypothetical protein
VSDWEWEDDMWEEYADSSDCPEHLAQDLEYEVEDLPKSRWLRRSAAAIALGEVEDAALDMWTYNDHDGDAPWRWVHDEEGIDKAREALEAFRMAVRVLAETIVARRILNRQQRRAAHHGRTVARPDETPRRCRTHAPPGKLVSTSPNRPHGPPLSRVALDVMAAAA